MAKRPIPPSSDNAGNPGDLPQDSKPQSLEPGQKPQPPDANKWLSRIRRAQTFKNQVRDRQGWNRILDMYKGDYKIAGQAIKAPPINIVYGYVQTAIARIYFRDPYMTVAPKGAQYIDRARLLEIVVNYLFTELGLKNESAKVLMDAFLIGHGWLKFGYSGQVQEAEGEVPNSESEYIKSEEIFVAYVPWEDIVFDVTLCKDPPHDCRWIAHRIIRPLSEIKGNPRYQNTELLSSNVSAKDTRGEKIDDSLRDNDLDLFEFWEVWDKDSNKIYCVADGAKDFLREAENTYEMNGLPFAMLKFNSIPGEPYPLSDIAIIEPQILERIKLRAAQVNHIKRWSRQLSIEKGAMDKESIEKFAQGVDGAITERQKGSAPPVPIQYADMQKESFLLDDLIQRDMDAEIGQNDVERGGQARTKTGTLGELRDQQAGTSSRAAKRQDQLEDFLEEVATKIIALIKQFQTTPKYVRITGMSPEEIAQAFQGLQTDATGIMFTKDDIQGEYDVEAKAGSTLPMNRENKIKIIEALLNPAIAQIIGIMPGTPISFELGKELIRELDLKGAEKAYEQMIQQLQAQQQAQQAMAQPGLAPGGPPSPGGQPGLIPPGAPAPQQLATPQPGIQ